MAGTLDDAFMIHRPALLRYLRARGTSDEAEDLLQDLWLKVLSAGALEADDTLAYLYRMAHNLMLDRRRASMRRKSREEKYQDTIGEIHATPDAEQVLLARENLRAVDQVLASLGAKTDYIFRRHRVEGIAQREIAAELGVTLSAVEKHLQKAYRAVAAMHASFAMTQESEENRETDIERR
ncbi:RNA polymerase sigma factor [Sphingomonas oryzagri]